MGARTIDLFVSRAETSSVEARLSAALVWRRRRLRGSQRPDHAFIRMLPALLHGRFAELGLDDDPPGVERYNPPASTRTLLRDAKLRMDPSSPWRRTAVRAIIAIPRAGGCAVFLSLNPTCPAEIRARLERRLAVIAQMAHERSVALTTTIMASPAEPSSLLHAALDGICVAGRIPSAFWTSGGADQSSGEGRCTRDLDDLEWLASLFRGASADAALARVRDAAQRFTARELADCALMHVVTAAGLDGAHPMWAVLALTSPSERTRATAEELILPAKDRRARRFLSWAESRQPRDIWNLGQRLASDAARAWRALPVEVRSGSRTSYRRRVTALEIPRVLLAAYARSNPVSSSSPLPAAPDPIRRLDTPALLVRLQAQSTFAPVSSFSSATCQWIDGGPARAFTRKSDVVMRVALKLRAAGIAVHVEAPDAVTQPSATRLRAFLEQPLSPPHAVLAFDLDERTYLRTQGGARSFPRGRAFRRPRIVASAQRGAGETVIHCEISPNVDGNAVLEWTDAGGARFVERTELRRLDAHLHRSQELLARIHPPSVTAVRLDASVAKLPSRSPDDTNIMLELWGSLPHGLTLRLDAEEFDTARTAGWHHAAVAIASRTPISTAPSFDFSRVAVAALPGVSTGITVLYARSIAQRRLRNQLELLVRSYRRAPW